MIPLIGTGNNPVTDLLDLEIYQRLISVLVDVTCYSKRDGRLPRAKTAKGHSTLA
jgi:hypothetical protein